MSRPILATVFPSAFAANIRRARVAAEGAKVFAIIKANAYGHGIERLTPAYAEADGLGILELDAACRLRDAGVSGPLLLLEGFFEAREVPEIARRGFATAVHCEEQLGMLAAARIDRPLDVYVKFNSGMNRLGFALTDLGAVLDRLRRSSNVRSLTLMSHFACADEEGGTVEPLRRFEKACEGIELPRSFCNSAALLNSSGNKGDVVRPGIMLYGSSPMAQRSVAELGLAPVMELSSEIIGVQTLQPGDAVGYGGTFVAEQAMRIGIVACGYADGYPRHAPTGTPVIVAGVRTRLLGRVSMDMIAVDLTSLPQAVVGAPVELWGRQLSVDEVAHAAGTIGYELLCAVAQRVPFRVGE